MAKRIDAALKELIKALREHAVATSASPTRAKRIARANSRLQHAVDAYARAVYKRTGTDTAFSDVVRPGLEQSIFDSLAAERDAFVAEHG